MLNKEAGFGYPPPFLTDPPGLVTTLSSELTDIATKQQNVATAVTNGFGGLTASMGGTNGVPAMINAVSSVGTAVGLVNTSIWQLRSDQTALAAALGDKLVALKDSVDQLKYAIGNPTPVPSALSSNACQICSALVPLQAVLTNSRYADAKSMDGAISGLFEHKVSRALIHDARALLETHYPALLEEFNAIYSPDFDQQTDFETQRKARMLDVIVFEQTVAEQVH